MKKLFLAVLLFACVCAAQTNIRANNGTFTGDVSVAGTISSSHVGATNAAFTAGPIATTVSAGFINSLTQTNQFAHGFADEANVAPTPAAGGYASFSAAPAFNLTTNTNHYNGYQFFPTLSGSSTLTSLIGSESAPIINTTSPVTELDDFYVQDATGTGSLTLHRGLFIGPLTKASTSFGFVVQTPSIIGYTSATGNQLIIESEAAPSSGNGPAQLHVTGAANPNEQTRIGFDTTALVGTIQAETAGTSFNPLALQPNGGGTFIGSYGTPINLTGQTANLAATTIYTTNSGTGIGKAGMYRVCAAAWTTSTGNSTVTINVVTPSGAGTVTALLPQTLNTVALTNPGGGCTAVHVAASSTIQVSVTGYNTTGTYSIQATAEQLF